MSVLGLANILTLTENRSRSPIPIPHDPWTLVYLLYMLQYVILSCNVTWRDPGLS